MKHTIHIGAKFLLAYIITLPILLGYHSLEHSHDLSKENGKESSYSYFTPDCELCDLYYSEAALNTTLAIRSVPNGYIHQTVLSQSISPASQELSSLRGPPLS